MAVDIPQQVLNDYLMSRSVMDDPRSVTQRVLDLVFGRTLPEQAANAFTAPLGAITPRPSFTSLVGRGQGVSGVGGVRRAMLREQLQQIMNNPHTGDAFFQTAVDPTTLQNLQKEFGAQLLNSYQNNANYSMPLKKKFGMPGKYEMSYPTAEDVSEIINRIESMYNFAPFLRE